MSPPTMRDQALLGAAQPSGSDSRSTASDNAMVCGGTNNPWTALTISQFWNGSSWDNSVADLPIKRQFWCAGGNYDNYMGAAGDYDGTGNERKDTFQWDGSAWTAEGSGYPQTDNYHNVGGSFGGNNDEAFIHSGQSSDFTPSYMTVSGYWNGTAWAESVASSYGGQGNTGDGIPEDFIATAGYGLNGTASAHQTFKTESFSKTRGTWVAEADFPTTGAGSNNAGGYGGGAASGRESFMAFVNDTDSTVADIAFYYDGTSWTASASDLADANKYGAGGGDSSSGIFCGGIKPGETTPEPWGAKTSQLYDGATDVFTATADLDDGFSAGGMGANT